MKIPKEIESWTPDKSDQLYGISNWGLGYFKVNNQGNLAITPDGQPGPEIDLAELVQSVSQRDIELPVLFRFNGILRHRIRSIYQAFARAIEENGYKGRYYPAYPIKVNQQRHVVDVIREVGRECCMGLEVGSKPELIAVLGLLDNPDALLLCNGYKDENYIEFALMAQKVGRNPVITIEKFSEIDTSLKVGKRLNIDPQLGFRIKLAGRGAGRWEHSGGDRSKFGLSISEIVQGIEELRRHDKLHLLRLLHFHIGSQITSIASFRAALKEACQVYVQLRRICPNLTYLDVGGGLGVDYDGSKTAFESSMNYTVEEYARDVIWTVEEVCREADVPQPDIVTESGRATVAHHAVLVFNVLGVANTFSESNMPLEAAKNSEDSIVKNMAQLLADITPKNCQETLHDTVALRSDMLQQFNLGHMSIEDRALGDKCYWALISAIAKASQELNYRPEDLERVPAMLTDTYFCNFSIFQSLPDHWAIEQIFPITPISQLNQEPNARVVLADITCDSDGTINKFADLRDVKRFLPAHKIKAGESYYLAAFLVGAYQEILGDLHNLFGDTNAIHVEVNEDGKAELVNVVYGDNVRDVLKYVQYDKEDLCGRWRTALEKAVASGKLSASESGEIYRKYSGSFDSYTYLEGDI